MHLNIIKNNIHLLVIFLIFFINRYLFVSFFNLDGLSGYPDIERYLKYSDNILRGEYNLAIELFIPAPLHYYLLALFKKLFLFNWVKYFLFFQIFLSSISAIFICKLSYMIFKDKLVSVLSLIIFFFFIPTMWFVGFFLQESNFQSFMIIFIYYFIKSLKNKSYLNLFLASIFFSISIHIKSHLLLFSPFIPIIILFFNDIEITKKIKFIIIITSISLISTIPYGYYNLKINGSYVFASSGIGVMFFVAHSDDAYKSLVDPPTKYSVEWEKLRKGQTKTWENINLNGIKKLNNKEMQKKYFYEGLIWIKSNPEKTFLLKYYSFIKFLTPGVSYYWYDNYKWLLILIISTPIYLMGYLGIFFSIKKDWRDNFWIVSIFISMLFFSVFFLSQNRFRTVTIEPFYIIYASYFGIFIFSKFVNLRKKLSKKNPI